MQKNVSSPSLVHGGFSGFDEMVGTAWLLNIFLFLLFAVILTPAHILIVFLQQRGGEVEKLDFAPLIFHISVS